MLADIFGPDLLIQLFLFILPVVVLVLGAVALFVYIKGHTTNRERLSVGSPLEPPPSGSGLIWRQGAEGRWEYQGPDGQWHPYRPATSSPAAQGAPSSQPAAKVAANNVAVGAWLALVAGAVVVIGSLMPSASSQTISLNIFQLGAPFYQGSFLVLCGVITGLIGITRLKRSPMPRFLQWSSIVMGLAAGLLAVTAIVHLHRLIHGVSVGGPFGPSYRFLTASIGYGAWVAVAGGVLAIVAGFPSLSARR